MSAGSSVGSVMPWKLLIPMAWKKDLSLCLRIIEPIDVVKGQSEMVIFQVIAQLIYREGRTGDLFYVLSQIRHR